MSDSKSGSKSNLNESNMPLLDDVSSFSSQKKQYFFTAHKEFYFPTFTSPHPHFHFKSGGKRRN